MLPVTIAGHPSWLGKRWGPGPWCVHQGGDILHELWGSYEDARRWIREHGLTYDPTLVNP